MNEIINKFLLVGDKFMPKMHLKVTSTKKMITSQIVSSEAQVKNFLILLENYVSFSRYSSFLFSTITMIYQICDVMMSIVHKTGCIFEYIFSTTTH